MVWGDCLHFGSGESASEELFTLILCFATWILEELLQADASQRFLAVPPFVFCMLDASSGRHQHMEERGRTLKLNNFSFCAVDYLHIATAAPTQMAHLAFVSKKENVQHFSCQQSFRNQL